MRGALRPDTCSPRGWRGIRHRAALTRCRECHPGDRKVRDCLRTMLASGAVPGFTCHCASATPAVRRPSRGGGPGRRSTAWRQALVRNRIDWRCTKARRALTRRRLTGCGQGGGGLTHRAWPRWQAQAMAAPTAPNQARVCLLQPPRTGETPSRDSRLSILAVPLLSPTLAHAMTGPMSSSHKQLDRRFQSQGCRGHRRPLRPRRGAPGTSSPLLRDSPDLVRTISRYAIARDAVITLVEHRVQVIDDIALSTGSTRAQPAA